MEIINKRSGRPPGLSLLIRSTTTDDNNLLEKLKEMAKNSKTDESFDTQKFADLLDEYTRGLYSSLKNYIR